MRKSAFIGCMLIACMAMCLLGYTLAQSNIKNKELTIALEESQLTASHYDQLQEGLIKGEVFTLTRKEGEDTVRYVIGSCVKKEIQMFVPVTK